MGEISVNSESVRNGISNIEKALDAIKKSQNNINSAVDNLEKGIGSFNFQSIMSKLSSADARSGEIIRKSDDYISDAKAAEEILSNIYDDIYGNQSLDASSLLDFDGNIELSSEDISLSSSEFNSLLTLLYQTNHAEDAAGLALQMLDSYDGISDSDKEYIMDQMAEGNIRAAVQYILTLMAKQDLEALKDKNNAKIKELETKKGTLLLKYYNENPNDDSIPQSTDIKVIDDEIARLKREISAQERVVRQYERANREWEYDKYFNKIGTEEFDIVVEIDFFNAAKDYYNDPDQSRRKNDPIIRDKGTYELAMASILLNDNADDSFINWLKSDECDLENKDKLIDYYNRKIAGNDQSEIEIANKIIDAHRIEQETELPNIYKYEFLSSEEKEVLLYLYLTEGEKAAGQFVEDFKDTINKRWGYNKANEIFTNIITASENGVGVLGANWEGIKIGTEGWFSRMGEIFDSSGVNTGEEYAQMYVNSLLASLSYLTVIDASDVDNYIKDPSSLQKIKERQKNGEQITYADILAETGQITPEQAEGLKLMLKDERVAKFMNDSEASVLGSTHREWLKRFYNAGVSTGAMLPSMVISMATSGILGAGGAATTTASTAGKYAGVASMFGYEFSVSRSEAIREGRSELEADIFALLSAGGEGGSEYLIGGIPFISKGANLFKISPDSSLGWNVVKGLLNMFVIAPGQEILQEEVQGNILDPLSQLIPYGETDYEFSLEEFIETAITTYISTVEMQGLSVVSTVNEINLANLNKNTGVAVVEFNGQEIEISASDILSCMDEKGKLSPEKMGEVVAGKSGINFKAALQDRVSKPTLDEETTAKNERQLAKILKKLMVVKYGSDIQTLVNSYMTANGFDYQGFLNYIAKNGRIHDGEYQDFYKLDDVKALRENPKENLARISEKLKDIIVYINEHGIESLSETNFDYLSFLSYCVASDSKFRTENYNELLRIGIDLSKIERSLYDATRFATNYKGVDIITYGANTEILNERMQRLLNEIDTSSNSVKKMFHDLGAIKIYDGTKPEGLITLLVKRGSDPETKNFVSSGTFDPNENAVIIYETDDVGRTFRHEISHKLDNAISSLTSTIGDYFTEEHSDWKNAVKQDNNSVSIYGDTKITEDFAEFGMKYSEALMGITDINEFRKKYPNRIKLFEDLVRISDAAHGDIGGNLSRTLDALGTFDSYLGNNPSVLHKVLDTLNMDTAPENRISQAELLAKHGIVNQYINGYIKNEGFFDGFNGEQMMELYNVYERRGANQLPYVANTMLKSCEYDSAAVIDSLSSIEIKQGDWDAIIMSNIMDGLRYGDYERVNYYICEGMMDGNNPELFNDVVKTVLANKKVGGA